MSNTPQNYGGISCSYDDASRLVVLKLGQHVDVHTIDTDAVTQKVCNYLEAVSPDAKVCIFDVGVEFATSNLIRIIFEIYRQIRRLDGELIVSNFPNEYMIALGTLGLTELPGFTLAGNLDEAKKRALKSE